MVASKDLPKPDVDVDEQSRRAERRALEIKKRERRSVLDDYDDEIPSPRRSSKAGRKPRPIPEVGDNWEDSEEGWEDDEDDEDESLEAEPATAAHSDESADADDDWGGVRDDWRPSRGRRGIYPSAGYEDQEDDLD